MKTLISRRWYSRVDFSLKWKSEFWSFPTVLRPRKSLNFSKNKKIINAISPYKMILKIKNNQWAACNWKICSRPVCLFFLRVAKKSLVLRKKFSFEKKVSQEKKLSFQGKFRKRLCKPPTAHENQSNCNTHLVKRADN